MDRIKVIIVDDEWLVRSELKQMLAEYPDIVVAGEAADVHQANQLIQAVNPDVIFLDVQMPGESGFDLIEKAHIQCKVIFITAYNQYALRAFEVNALDYLKYFYL